MDYATIAALRDRHPAWRLLRAGNSVLILSFLCGFFVEGNRGACSAKEIAQNIDVVLEAAVKRVQDCDCGEEASCYGCLRTYRNGRFQELLLRSAALQILGS